MDRDRLQYFSVRHFSSPMVNYHVLFSSLNIKSCDKDLGINALHEFEILRTIIY